jgi:acetyl-CoA carboxylase biotin carboxyl carrier protein
MMEERPGMSAPTPNQDIFDVRRVRRLVELMKEHDLSEIDMREGETRIRLRRGSDPVVSVAAPRVAAAPLAAPPAAAQVSAAEEPKADEAHIAVIKSPIVGTFYAAPNPESPPFVKVGDHVGAETTVCIVEAMKVFNQIPAEVSGKITVRLVENGQPVEFGQPLFKVDTRG